MKAPKRLGNFFGRCMTVLLPVLFLLALPQAATAENGNRLNSIRLDSANGQAVIVINTEAPIGYRYTVYDSQDPLRVIVDFRGMEIGELASPMASDVDPIEEVRTSSFDLTSGKLGRVEILLAAPSTYDVALNDTALTLTISRETPLAEMPERTAAAAVPAEPVSDVADAEATATEEAPALAVEEAAPSPVSEAPAPAAVPEAPATTVRDVSIGNDQVLFVGDGSFEKIRYFSLAKPTRLVVDLYDVKAAFKAREFPLSGDFTKLRVGTYNDKIRFVFDASGKDMANYAVDKEGASVVVRWGDLDAKQAAATTPPPAAPAVKAVPVPQRGPLAVQALDFYQEGESSVFAVTMAGPPDVIETTREGDLVRFGVRHASLNREFRRVIDSSAFPSSIRLITPYTVQRGAQQDVYFAVEMKGAVDYRLDRDDGKLLFVADNGPYTEASPAALELREVETVAAPPADGMGATDSAESASADAAPVTGGVAAEPAGASAMAELAGKPIISGGYTGQRISLVFDNADIRNVLQLIADVSQLNIIATDEVQGNLSIRLIDVPWDQALDIVLDIKDLGKVQIDNVVRILPKERIREMEAAELNAAKNKRDIAPLVTRVIPISYSDLGSISNPVRELLTERGKVTEDSRNKQIIVTDVAEILDEVEKLVAILDTPERQVMIEARIVEANTTFSRDLGVKWGVTWRNVQAEDGDLSSAAIGGGGSFLIQPPGVGGIGGTGLGSEFVFGRLGVDNTILDLRLSALETAGQGKIISTPRVTTLNGKAAVISQGTKIPYQTQSDDGPTTEFESAELKLEVTPEINPDNSIILDIKASNSSQGANVPTGLGSAPAIDDKKAETTVLVRDGETTVIGGIFVENELESEAGVPVLMHIPLLGHMFKSTSKSSERRELLIFVTPRILNN